LGQLCQGQPFGASTKHGEDLKTTLTHEDLKAAGFRQYQTSVSNATTTWQRIQRGENGEKLYFVNIGEWRFAKSHVLPIDVHNFEVEVAMYPKGVGDDDHGMRLKFSVRNVDELESVENFIHNFFLQHNCPPDIHNN